MSGLPGTDPTASTGISGDATHAQQAEPVMERTEGKSELKKEIGHTNIGMSLDVLHKQYIYKGTFSWSTTDAPGKVLAKFPIHPDACNVYTAHVYRMLNAWVGGMKTRVRIIGTAFFGGGLYLVRIPPNFTASQIENMNLVGFSTFPHTDIDPKNLSSIDVSLEDYRDRHFHSGELDLNDPSSFGGWFALVVNARLVTQSTEVHSVDMRVEMAGDFTFNVPVPIRMEVTEAGGPIPAEHCEIRTLTGCDDVYTLKNSMQMVACSSRRRMPHNGMFYMRRAGGEWTYRDHIEGTFTNENLSEQVRLVREKINDGVTPVTENRIWKSYTETPMEMWMKWSELSTHGGLIDMIPFNFRWGSSNGAPVPNTTDPATYNFVRVKDIHPGGEAGGEAAIIVELYGAITRPAVLAIGAFEANEKVAMDEDDLVDLFDPTLPDSIAGNESFVIFATNNHHTGNFQPKEWGESLREFQWPSGNAAAYDVFDRNDTLIARVKVCENGHTYTNAVSTATAIDQYARLRFSQWVPENQILPTPTAFIARQTNAAIAAAVRKEQKAMRKYMAQLKQEFNNEELNETA